MIPEGLRQPAMDPTITPEQPFQRDAAAHAHRFNDWDSMQFLSIFGKDGSSRSQTFYNGETLSTRMTTLRQAIIYVRENWKDYPILMADLRSYIADIISEADDQHLLRYLPIVLTSLKVWNSDLDTVADDENLSVIRLYTSKAGYDQIFRIINQAFRTEDVAEQIRRVRCAVFLIELLNIDLFNYTLRMPRSRNFEGTVYRGVVFSGDQLQDFKVLAARPVAERYWAIPMAMMSASTDRSVALREFAGQDNLTDITGTVTRHPFLWRIHVIGLSSKYLQIYRERFPTSVVSTIGAVPIRELSDYAEEDEVLLRGPFFQLVCLQEEVFEGQEKPVHVMDLIMINANRDHPSTMQLSAEEGDSARQLFACLVGMRRAEICRELASLYSLVEDAALYDEMFRAGKAKFATLVS